ncbi:hypothetical protein [Paenibacillus ihbetae]|uniref:hypothetical protein n=1 Tax=Paenibacillus ihbetae TaxID=1870820 RepID=UPI0016754685|nr:hypothetical protein [Paenibacillus ihbetae]
MASGGFGFIAFSENFTKKQNNNLCLFLKTTYSKTNKHGMMSANTKTIEDMNRRGSFHGTELMGTFEGAAGAEYA